jgi:hypothetical protein
MAYDLPKLLYTPKLEIRPKWQDYGDLESDPEERDSDGLVVGATYDRLFFGDVAQYEATLLRPIYVEERDRLSPGWSQRYQDTKFHRLFETQVMGLERENADGDLEGWLEAYQYDGKAPQVVQGGICWPQSLEEYVDPDEVDNE